MTMTHEHVVVRTETFCTVKYGVLVFLKITAFLKAARALYG